MKLFRFLLCVVACSALVALSGCGAQKAEPPAKAANVLNISLHQDPPKLDPSLSTSVVDRVVFQSIYDKLLDLDANGQIVPMLAEKWEVSPDQKTYTFKLRQGVKFHDGADFNAEAVKFNFERNKLPTSERRNELKEVTAVTVLDPYTVKVELGKPFAPFLSILTDRAGMMVSPAAVKKFDKDFLNNPVGTGPFAFKERIKGSSITLDKNPSYWQKGLPKVDKVVYKILPDTTVALTNLKSGQVDITNRFPFNEINAMQNDPKIQAINQPGQGFRGIYLNVSKAPFNNKSINQALDLLIDRDAIVKVVYSGAATPGRSPFAPNSFPFGPSDKPLTPDLAKAKELLRQAGKPDGFKFTLKIDTDRVSQQVGQMLQTMLQPAGIEVTLEKVEWGTLLDQTIAGNYEAALVGWSGRPDPDQNVYDWYVTGASNNYMKYSNKEVDRLLGEARLEIDQSKRKALYDQAMAILNDELPYIVLCHDHNVFGLSRSVQGFTYVPDGMIRTATLSK